MSWWSKLFKKRSADPPFELHYRTVIVYVHDGKTLEPLAGVHLTGPLGTTETRSDGRAELSSADARLAVVAELDGYTPQRREVDLDTTQPTVFFLAPAMPVSTAPETNLRGRFVIKLPFVNPFIALGTPNAKPDRFFMSELDSLWRKSPKDARRVLDYYKSLGYNHVPVGPAVEYGYSGQVPDTNWLDAPDLFADYLVWMKVTNGVNYSLFVLPNCGDWWRGGRRGWNLDIVERDFAAIYTHPVVQALTTHVVHAWEEVATIAEMCKVFRLLVRWFPKARRGYHNPVGHLGPGESDESEEGSVRECAAAGMTDLEIQTHPRNGGNFERPGGLNDDGRTSSQQAFYDVGDMARRCQGLPGSPWGRPVLTREGAPVTVRYMEGLAYEDYWTDPQYDRGPEYRAAMLAIPGVTDVLDA